MEWKRISAGCWHGYLPSEGLCAFIVAQTDGAGKRIYRYTFMHNNWGIVRSIPRARRIIDRIVAKRSLA